VKKLTTAIALVAIATAMLAIPAFAQVMPNVLGPERGKLKTDVEVKEEQDRENGFKSGLSKIPDQKAKIDPWGNVRGSTPPSQGQAKQAPK
jgi:hypothetical protein